MSLIIYLMLEYFRQANSEEFYLYNLFSVGQSFVVLALCVALGVALIDNQAAWHAYYLAAAASLVLCLLRLKDVKNWLACSPFWMRVFLASLIIMGGMELSWSLLYGRHEAETIVYINGIDYPLVKIYARHFDSGLALLLSLPLFACLHNMRLLSRPAYLFWMAAGLFFLMLATFALGLHEWLAGVERIQMKGDGPITTAMEFFFIVILVFSLGSHLEVSAKLKAIGAIIIIACGFVFVSLTDTRSVLVLLAFFYIWYATRVVPLVSLRFCLFFVTAVFFVFIGAFFYFDAVNRLFLAYYEVTQYLAGQPVSSMGARFSMWKGAIYAFLESPWTNSIVTRYQYAQNYILLHEHGNAEAIRAMLYHVHNEYLDALSLKSLPGLLGFLALLMSGTLMALRSRQMEHGFVALMLAVMVYCLFDSFFIHRDLVMLFCVMVALYFALNRNDQAKPDTSEEVR